MGQMEVYREIHKPFQRVLRVSDQDPNPVRVWYYEWRATPKNDSDGIQMASQVQRDLLKCVLHCEKWTYCLIGSVFAQNFQMGGTSYAWRHRCYQGASFPKEESYSIRAYVPFSELIGLATGILRVIGHHKGTQRNVWCLPPQRVSKLSLNGRISFWKNWKWARLFCTKYIDCKGYARRCDLSLNGRGPGVFHMHSTSDWNVSKWGMVDQDPVTLGAIACGWWTCKAE